MPVLAAYPGAIAAFSTKTDVTDVVYAAHPNSVQAEIVAVQTVLGTNPQGSAATVKQRMANIEAAVADIEAAFNGSGQIPESQVTNLVDDLTALNAAIGARLLAAANLSDVPNPSTARTNLGAASVSHGHDYVDRVTAQSIAGVKTFTDGAASPNNRATGDFTADGGDRAVSSSYRAQAPDTASGLIDYTFVAPPSGRALLLQFARINTHGTGNGYFSARVRVNPTGTIVADFDDDHAVRQDANTGGPVSGCSPRFVTGLTPGTTYRVEAGFKALTAMVTFDSYGVHVLPSM